MHRLYDRLAAIIIIIIIITTIIIIIIRMMMMMMMMMITIIILLLELFAEGEVSPGDYSTILTEPEVNNCFSIFTRSDLNRIRKETIKKMISLIDG